MNPLLQPFAKYLPGAPPKVSEVVKPVPVIPVKPALLSCNCNTANMKSTKMVLRG